MTRMEQIAADWKECDGLALTPSEEGDHRRIGYLLTVATALAAALRLDECVDEDGNPTGCFFWACDGVGKKRKHTPDCKRKQKALALFDAEVPPHA